MSLILHFFSFPSAIYEKKKEKKSEESFSVHKVPYIYNVKHFKEFLTPISHGHPQHF